jgi:hypothetical protein
MNIGPELHDLFDAYLMEYGTGYDKHSFVDFVVSQIVKPPGPLGYKSLVRYYRERASEIERSWRVRNNKLTAKIAKAKQPVKVKPLSIAQRRVMRNLLAGRSASAGVEGMSGYGGLQGTLMSLRRRGLLDDDNELTPAGLVALPGHTLVEK